MKNKQYTYNYFLNDERFLFGFLTGSLEDYRKEMAEESLEALEAFNQAEKIMHKTVTLDKNAISQNEIENEVVLLEQKIRNDIRIKRKWKLLKLSVSIAACFAVLFSIIEYKNFTQESEFLTEVNADIENKDTELFNINEVVLFQNGTLKKKFRSTNVAYIDFDSPKSGQNTINKVVVPFGKRAQIRLKDGTKVWINAGSVVYFPSEFEASKRDFFVDGEIFLEVTPDKQKPFVVKTREMSVKVLGTSFNVCSYSTKKDKSVLLVSGKVNVDYENTISELTPNECFQIQNNTTSIKSVDPTDYIAWKDGYFNLNDTKLNNLLQEISNYYNVKIINECSGEFTCSGKLRYDNSVDVLLEQISRSVPIKIIKESNYYRVVDINK